MEDFIMREIDKIGKIIEAILIKVGVLKRSGGAETVHSQTKLELAEKLDMDIDSLIVRNDFANILKSRYGFSDADLGKFTGLMLDFVETAPDKAAADKYVSAALNIFRHLEKTASDFSFDNYYILEELKKYM